MMNDRIRIKKRRKRITNDETICYRPIPALSLHPPLPLLSTKYSNEQYHIYTEKDKKNDENHRRMTVNHLELRSNYHKLITNLHKTHRQQNNQLINTAQMETEHYHETNQGNNWSINATNAFFSAQECDYDTRVLNAGIYMIYYIKSNYYYFNSTWDIENAKAQNYLDLQQGRHQHLGLSNAFHHDHKHHIYFVVLERITPMNAQAPVNIRSLEMVLKNRLQYHCTKFYKKAFQTLSKIIIRVFILKLKYRHWKRMTIQWNQLEIRAIGIISPAIEKWSIKHKERQQEMNKIAINTIKHCIQKWIIRQRTLQYYEDLILKKNIPANANSSQNNSEKILMLKCAMTTKLQKWTRMIICKHKLEKLRYANYREKACVKIQAQWRGYSFRMKERMEIRNLFIKDAAVTIQSIWRCLMAVREIKNRRLLLRKTKSAQIIQLAYKRFRRRENFRLYVAMLMHQSVLCKRIQTSYRKYRRQIAAHAAMQYYTKTVAATKIQQVVKAKLFFRELEALNQKKILGMRNRNQQVLQQTRIYKRLYNRKLWHTYTNAATLIQCARKRYKIRIKVAIAKENYRKVSKVLIIQKAWRSFIMKKALDIVMQMEIRHKSVVVLQSFARYIIAKNEVSNRKKLLSDGPCQRCRSHVAFFYSYSSARQLCEECIKGISYWELSTLIGISEFHKLTKSLKGIQTSYKWRQMKLKKRNGICDICELLAARIICRTCFGTPKYCFTCDNFCHEQQRNRLFENHVRLRVEWAAIEVKAAAVIQRRIKKHLINCNIKKLEKIQKLARVIACRKIWSYYRAYQLRMANATLLIHKSLTVTMN